MTSRDGLVESARAFAVVMGRSFVEGPPSGGGDFGAWILERVKESEDAPRRPLQYRLAELSPGGVVYPMGPQAFPPRSLVVALDFARLAVGVERTRRDAWELGYPYRGGPSQ